MTTEGTKHLAGSRVRRREGDLTGAVAHVYSRDFANMCDRDVSVVWDDATRTNERYEDLEKA